MAEALGVSRWVRPLPYLPQADFDEIRGHASVVVFPSDYEGFGLPVLEAMRSGVPVVITADRALLEVAGGHAVVAEAWTPQELSRAVERALSVSDCSVAAAQAYASRFTWREAARQTRDVLAAAAR
jgi:glycosyltransferase involved in cell wall biosynthesis